MSSSALSGPGKPLRYRRGGNAAPLTQSEADLEPEPEAGPLSEAEPESEPHSEPDTEPESESDSASAPSASLSTAVPNTSTPQTPSSLQGPPPDQDAPASLLDILRLLSGLLLLNCALSYLVTGDSVAWGYAPPPLARLLAPVQAYLRGPVDLTPEQLLLYNGSDPARPIYLAVNGSIYDVSASPHHYGPGGGYHFFAGRDGTRAFVTGCFALEHVTPDLRGVEEMFLPEGMGSIGPVNERERRRAAKAEVRRAVRNWEAFFAGNPKYFRVGRVLRARDWLDSAPRLPLCAEAERARPKPGVGGEGEGGGGREGGHGFRQ